MEEIVLDATHTGSTYGNPVLAIGTAFEEFRKRRREEELEFFHAHRSEMENRIRSYWKRMEREAKR